MRERESSTGGIRESWSGSPKSLGWRFSHDMSDETVKCFVSVLKGKAESLRDAPLIVPKGLLVDDLDSSK